jgi:hypothetical protein
MAFQPDLMFARKARAYPSDRHLKFFEDSRVGPWSYPQTLGLAGKAHLEQTL